MHFPLRNGAVVLLPIRIQYPGAIYQVMNRGDRREPIFENDEDRERFLDTFAQACEKTGWRSHGAYLVEPPRRPIWRRVDRLLGEWGIPKDSPAGREVFEARTVQSGSTLTRPR